MSKIYVVTAELSYYAYPKNIRVDLCVVKNRADAETVRSVFRYSDKSERLPLYAKYNIGRMGEVPPSADVKACWITEIDVND